MISVPPQILTNNGNRKLKEIMDNSCGNPYEKSTTEGVKPFVQDFVRISVSRAVYHLNKRNVLSSSCVFFVTKLL